jgi:hypothetical protein
MRGYYNPWNANNRKETASRVAELRRDLPARLKFYEAAYWDANRDGDTYALTDLKEVVRELRNAVEGAKDELAFLNSLGKYNAE